MSYSITGDQGLNIKGNSKMAVNVPKLLKTHIEKMPVFRLSIMLMKTNELS
jgi:hypothetical protein